MIDKFTHIESKNVEHLFRQQSGKMFSILIRLFGFEHSSLVEDIIQDTFLTAMKTWSIKGVPVNPEAWLMLVSKNKLLNELKKKSTRDRLNTEFALDSFEEKIDHLFLDKEIKDSQLRAFFACCHPSLNKKEQIIITLKILSGFSNAEIANALLSTESAIKKSVYRAKKSLREQEIDLNAPLIHQAQVRIETIHTIIYLIFNEGYKRTSGSTVIGEDLCFEASRLAFLISQIKGKHQSVTYALLALIYFSMARFPARVNTSGEMIELEIQDRSKWDHELINAGSAFLKKSRDSKHLSNYHLEATISSLHCSAATFDQTNWEKITTCYKLLLNLEDNPIININYAVALGKWQGDKVGLAFLDEMEASIPIESQIKSTQNLFHCAKASMLASSKQFQLAEEHYQKAYELTNNKMDTVFLKKKMDELSR